MPESAQESRAARRRMRERGKKFAEVRAAVSFEKTYAG